MSEKGFLKNCYISPRVGDAPMFHGREDGTIVAALEGYVIVPIEQYDNPNNLRNIAELKAKREEELV